jgi:hypothetical protein
MNFKTLFAVLFLLVSLTSRPVLASKTFGIQAMAFYSSQQLFRGAVVWPEPIFFPAPMLVFYEKFFLAGPNIFFSPTKREDHFQWRIGSQFIDDDDPPISLGDHEEDFRNRRKSTIETNFQASYNFGPRNKISLGTFISREWKEGNGLHSEFFAGVPFLPFTTIQGRVSFSEKGMSQYIHGRQGVSGFGFSSLGINGVIPFVPWDGVILVNFTRFWIMQDSNKAADYIRGDSKNNVFSVRVVWNAL